MPRKVIWRPVEDLPTGWQSMQSEELTSLWPIWDEQSRKLGDSEMLRRFNERLCREWAIETGIIEGLYSIDRGTTQLLIEHGWIESYVSHGSTDRPPGELMAILRDHEGVVDGLFDFVKGNRTLSTSYIKELHAAFTQHQPTTEAVDQFGNLRIVELLRGSWKELPNNPRRPDGTVFEYCPPEHVASEMDRLLAMHGRHRGVPVEIEAAWLHHRFTQIHPFQDGNGRVARALASLAFIRMRWFPLVIDRDQRGKYIGALESADAGDLSPLINMFADIQKKAFVRALSLADQVIQSTEPIAAVITSGVERLKARFSGHADAQRKVFGIGDRVQRQIVTKMQDIAARLAVEIKSVDHKYDVRMEESDKEREHWYNKDVITIAKKLDYFADCRTYKRWCRLTIYEERATHIVVSVHALGRDFVGILVASAFIKIRDRGEDGLMVDDGPYALCEQPLQFAFNERPEAIDNRLERWLNNVLLSGLETWRRGV